MKKGGIAFKIGITIAIIALIFLIINSPAVKTAIKQKENLKNEQIQTNTIVNEDVIVPNNKDENILEKINNATSVKVKEKVISLNKSYDIYIDGQNVANVSGKYVNITGDVFTLKDINGQVLMSEKQIKRWGIKLNRTAQIYDSKGSTVRLLWRR